MLERVLLLACWACLSGQQCSVGRMLGSSVETAAGGKLCGRLLLTVASQSQDARRRPVCLTGTDLIMELATQPHNDATGTQ